VDWLGLTGKTVLVTGLKNKKSVAWHAGTRLSEAGANVVWSVHDEPRAADARKLLPAGAQVFACDVSDDASIEKMAQTLRARDVRLHGLVHSIAFARFGPMDAGASRAFHATGREDFLRALDVSCFSLIALAHALEELFVPQASVVTISISTTTMAAENYGYMAPVKAALDSSVVFLAKSFERAGVRFNAVAAGLLKTSASAGIPGYLESYLFAEQATLRKKALDTGEVADAVVYLLSPRSSGINAQRVVVDAGMGVNFFDRGIVERATRPEGT
jgi:enoyl-[acyl-carrier protein] reductase I